MESGQNIKARYITSAIYDIDCGSRLPAKTIGQNLVKASEKLSEVEVSFANSSETMRLRYGDKTVDAWEDIESEPEIDGATGRWSSPFRSTIPGKLHELVKRHLILHADGHQKLL